MNRFSLGQIVQAVYGREAGSYFVVIDIESPRFVWVADGRSRTLEKPKKKNTKHLRVTSVKASKVFNAYMRKDTHVTNADIRSDLNQYLLEYKRLEKGE